jgi:hypothetical protein
VCSVVLWMVTTWGEEDYCIDMNDSLCSLAAQTKIDRSCSGTEEIGARHHTGRLNRGTMKRMWVGVSSGLGPRSR